MCLALSMLSATEGSATASTRLQVVDGDTMKLNGESIRLDGIDAPERNQTCISSQGKVYPCGRLSGEWLARLTAGAAVKCVGTETDRYERRIATCFADGRNLNSQMVRLGQAVAYRKYSRRYIADEMEARNAQRGMWSGTFDMPWAHRSGERQVRLAAAETAAASDASRGPSRPHCPIKGNISKSGHLYHLPGSSNYARTVIDETRGERWFCSEIEAILAGWRRAR